MATKLHESLKVQSLRGVKPSQEVVASLSMDPGAHGHEPKTETQPHHGILSMDPGAQECDEPDTTSQSHVELSLEPGVDGEGRKTETLLNHLDEHYHREEHHINEKVSNRTKILTSLAAGAVAGAVAKTTIAPLDRTKINFQTSQMPFSFRKATLFIYYTFKKEGFMALYRGNSATMARIVPYAAVQYMSHEQYKLMLLKKFNRKKYLPAPLRMLAGSLAGTTATTLTYPLDMVRARMAITGKDKYSTLRAVFRNIYREEGLRVMYRGFSPTVIGSAVYSGIGFGTYETLKKFHAEYNKGRTPTGLETWCMGACAGVCGQCSSYPLDIVRRRMQTAGVTGHTKDYTSIYRTAHLVFTQEGVKKGLYKGLSMNWIKGPISNGVSFLVFETVHRLLRKMTIFHLDDND